MKTPSTYAVTRQHILSDLDEVISQIILQADRIERLDVAVPTPALNETVRRLVAVTFALSFCVDRTEQPGTPKLLWAIDETIEFVILIVRTLVSFAGVYERDLN
jgi:hypothetical protein